MNIFKTFEMRISSIFDSSVGAKSPLSFKKLAKRAVKRMREETYEINGVNTAPALYTILVSPSDDAAMRPMYPQLCKETEKFLKAKAQSNKTSFVGEPLVRFMVDPSLRSAKFAVFAENIDARTLSKLRAEEEAFLGQASHVGGAALRVDNLQPVEAPKKQYAEISVPTFNEIKQDEPDSGLDIMPEDILADDSLEFNSSSFNQQVQQNKPSTPTFDIDQIAAPAPAPISVPSAVVPAPAQPQMPNPVGMGNVVPEVPKTQRRPSAVATNMPAPEPRPQNATCLLIDRQTGQTYTAHGPATIIGREKAPQNIVLQDSNVSRRHAQLIYDGRNWHIKDLNSTNGTLVNDVVIDDCILRDADLLTFGLINLEFREA